MSTLHLNPITIRDHLLEEAARPELRAEAIRLLVRRGWPCAAIVAEVPGVSEQEVRAALAAETAAA